MPDDPNALPMFDRLTAAIDSPTPSDPANPAPTPADPANPAPADPAAAPASSIEGFLKDDPAPADPANPDPANPAPADPAPADDAPPKGLTPKAAETWKTLKQENKEFRKKVEELSKSQLTEEQKAKLTQYEQENKTLQEKLTKYEREIAGVRIELTEEYQQQITRPLESVRSVVEDLANTYELDREALNSAVVEDDRKARVRKLAQLGESMLEPDRLKLYRAAEEFDAIAEAKVKLEENAEETLKNFEAERAEASRKAAVQEIEQVQKASDTLWPLMVKKAPILKDPTIAAAVKAEAASIDFRTARPDIKAYVAYAGAVLPKLVAAMQKSDARVAELTAQIEALKGTTPSGGLPPGGAPPAKTGGFLDSVEAGLR
jgi:hypothetical protein